ncbi:hypothetical protein ACR77J_08180 [Tissierella praeacuta]|uniref:hypothetical protein n=1 Tax=Tissierella praeacuta TaxID=43131 RepID=UPI003DA6480A
MNEFQQEIYKTIDMLTEEKLKRLGFDKTKQGKVTSVSDDSVSCIVRIDGEEFTCKLRRGIYVEPNDIVFVKFPQNSDIDRYVDTILGGNKTPENLVISAEEILSKLKTVDGEGSGLDADMLDGKHSSEYALKEDINISIDGDTIVQNINKSNSIIDDKNLSANINDTTEKKHSHSNKSIIDTITQTLIDTWNTVANKVDKVEGKQLSTEDFTTTEKNKLSSITTGATKNDTDANLKNRANHTGTQLSSTITDFTDAVRMSILTGLSTTTNAVITATDTVLSALGKLQRQVTDNLLSLNTHVENKSNPHNVTKVDVKLDKVDNTADTDKPISNATQLALNSKVDNSRVLTDVPVNAEFTDTITTINGKTGVISKTDIVALGIPAQDTIYTHPSTHPASMITGLSDVATSGSYNDLSNKPTIPTDTNQLVKSDVYTKIEVNNLLSNAGQGDMMKNVYDTNNNGKVDIAEVAESIDWDNITGKKIFSASTSVESSLSIPHGAAPSSPNNGDMWTTTAGLYLRLNGVTRTMAHTASWSTVSQLEAETGTATTQRFWTAQRVRQAILATPIVRHHIGTLPPNNQDIPWIDTSL